MTHPNMEVKIDKEQLSSLFKTLQQQGYKLIGPKLENKAITYDTLDSIHDLPMGWQDIQDKGFYRLQKRNDNALFGYNIGSRSFKQFLFPSQEKILSLQQGNKQPLLVKKQEKLALIGVRACELAAIQIQDKVFNSSAYPDPRYQQRRANTLIISLNCHTTTNTCFCVSMNTGPEVKQGYDINLSEIILPNEHYFLCQAGSTTGEALLKALQSEPITIQDQEHKSAMISQTAANMGRTLDTHQIKEKLYAAHDHAHWDTIAETCINCANCTMACPTCFCSKIEDTGNLEQTEASRTKIWDSCFSQSHSYIHDAYVRPGANHRYRQWMTHKLASWYDQFDTSGCVGCGRCITWCPVGIDITEEIKHFDFTSDNHENNP